MREADWQTLQVSERFQLKRILGAGGFGIVYEAYDRDRDETVALKALRQTDPRALRRFKREFRSVTDLAGRHANLVTLYEFFDERHVWFFTMQLVDGVDLVTYVRGAGYTRSDDDSPTRERTALEASATPSAPAHRCPALTSNQIHRLRRSFRQLAEGLLFVHRGGILHRDIKPSNVLVTKNGHVLLLDFGLLSEFHEALGPDMTPFVGTPAYSSPEQLRGEPLTEAADWFSFGVLLFQALTTDLPNYGGSERLGKVWPNRKAPRASDLTEGVPPDLDDLCVRLLDPLASNRPSGNAVLEHFLETNRARTRRVVEGPPLPSDLHFVGRARELGELQRMLDAVGESIPVAVLVRGESGIGKTSLVRRFLNGLGTDVLVFTGRCFERESVPYQGFDSLVDELSDYLIALPPEQLRSSLPRDIEALEHLFPVLKRASDFAQASLKGRIVPDAQLRRRAFAALRDLLARISSHERRVLLLFIDDLQWADSDSADLLNALVKAEDCPPLLFIGCYRSDSADSSPFLKRTRKAFGDEPWHGRFLQLDVGPLSAVESKTLAMSLLPNGAESQSNAEAAARESGGNPFFVGVLVKYVATAEAGTPEVPARGSLDALIRRRIATLGTEARRLVSLVAVAGRPLLTSVALSCTGVRVKKQNLIVNLKLQQLLRKPATGSQDELETYHDRIRKSVIEALSAEELAAHHADLARELSRFVASHPETLTQYSEVLAWHFESAGDRVQAVHYLERAGTHAFESVAFDHAVRLLEHALELSVDNAERRRLRIQLGEALANAKRGPEAARMFVLAADEGPTTEAIALRIRAMEELLRSGHVEAGLEALRRVLGELGMRLPSSRLETLVRVALGRYRLGRKGLQRRAISSQAMSPEVVLRLDSCWAVATGLGGVDVLLAADFHNRHALLALEVGDAPRRARALASEACYLAMAGVRSKTRAEVYIQEAMTLSTQLNDPRLVGLSTLATGQTAFCVGEWDRARSLCEDAKRILASGCTGVGWELDSADILIGLSLCWAGSLREVWSQLGRLLEDVEERGDLYAETMLRVSCGGLLSLASDHPQGARDQVDYAMKRWSARRFHVQHIYATAIEAQIELYDGRPDAALAILRKADSLPARLLLSGIQVMRVQMLDLRGRCLLASAGGARDASRCSRRLRGVERCVSQIEGEITPWGNALARVLRAGLAAARKSADDGPEWLRLAQRDLEANQMALHAAAVQRRYGDALGGAEGARAAAEADAWMRRQGIENPARMTAMLVPGLDAARR